MTDNFQPVFEKLAAWREQAVAMLPNLVVAILVLVLFWLLAKLMRTLVKKGVGRVSENVAVTRLIATLTYLLVLVIGVVVALGVLKLDDTVTSVLAGAGIIGLALAFAFQDAAENLISGVVISVRQPFRVGDLIEPNGHMGTVENITLRSTALRRPAGQLVLITNATVFKNPLINYTETLDRRVDLEIGVSYGDDLEQVVEVAIAALDGLEGRNLEREAEFFYTGFGGSSVDFVLRFWLLDAYQGSFLAARHRAIIAVKKAFDAAGITIPFPIRTLDFGVVGGKELSEMLPESTRPPGETP
jgi:small conductance mechanosensitive channel